MTIRPTLFSTFTQRCQQFFSTLRDLWDKGPPLFCRHLPAFVLTSSVCAMGYMWRSEGKFSSRSSSSTLFQRGSFCSLSDWIPSSLYSPISDSISLEQGWDSSCSHYASIFYVDYWDLNSTPCLHGKLFGPLHHHSSLLCPTFRHSLYKSLLLSPYSWNSAFSQKPKVICMILESTTSLPI